MKPFILRQNLKKNRLFMTFCGNFTKNSQKIEILLEMFYAFICSIGTKIYLKQIKRNVNFNKQLCTPFLATVYKALICKVDGKCTTDLIFLANRRATEQLTINISQSQYNKLIEKSTQFCLRRHIYSSLPTTILEYNCTTACVEILRSAGIIYLPLCVMTPYDVKAVIINRVFYCFEETVPSIYHTRN